VIPNPERQKGAAALGATTDGQPGPFGIRNAEDGQDEPKGTDWSVPLAATRTR
jgi:hypothetical protein